ncbi:MAG TPA: hypothetical protein VK914_02170 [bacterium]|jgi:hypothetical protein|nr:hypothetical protein [bacterium]
MLLFSSNSFTVNGITVFPDHIDPNQFWYLPGPVTLESEPGSAEPQFLLITYAPDVAAAGIQGTGFLNVTVCLALSQQNKVAIMGQIQNIFPAANNPLLSPVSFDSGTVQIVALDMQGGGGTTLAAGSVASNQAVDGILGASDPELFGNNDALFALTLSEEGATILEKAFQDGMTPVGAIYNMQFTGIQPALDVKITADLSRVYTSFSVDLSAKAYFATADIDATFENLKQTGAIKIDIVNMLAGTAGVDQQNQALNLFKDQILSQWFTPSLSPTTEAAADASNLKPAFGAGGGAAPATSTTTTTTAGRPAGGTGSNMTSAAPSSSSMAAPAANKGSSTMTSAAPAAGAPSSGAAPAAAPAASGSSGGAAKPASGTTTTTAPPAGGAAANPVGALLGSAAGASQAASPFGVALKLKYVSQTEQKTVEYDYNQMQAVQRTYAPQGYFGLLLQGIDQSKHFLQVDGTDPFFNQFAVTVNPPEDFTGIGLLEADVALQYGNPAATVPVKTGNFTFTPSTNTTQTWNVFQGLIQQTQFSYTANYKFDPESGWVGEKTAYALPAVTTENRVLNMDPYDFLGFLKVSVSADRLDPNLVDRIEVPLQYTAASGWQTSTTIIVRAGSAPQFWMLRLTDKTVNSYTYSTNCYLKSGTLISTPAAASTASAIIVNDPFVAGVDLTLQPAFSAAAYSQAIVEISYQDTANNYSFQTTVQIAAGAPTPPAVHISFINPALTSYQYRLTFITVANQQQQGAYITATDPLVLVGPPGS